MLATRVVVIATEMGTTIEGIETKGIALIKDPDSRLLKITRR